TRAVQLPMIRTAWWPRSWNCRSLRNGTVWPRWTSMPVGSMPYLTRKGLPVWMLRSSFWSSSSSGVICSTPRRSRAICSAALFMTDSLRSRSGIHLPAADCLEGMTMVDDVGFALVGRPGDGQYVEAGWVLEQSAAMEEVEGAVGQPALLGVIDRLFRPAD